MTNGRSGLFASFSWRRQRCRLVLGRTALSALIEPALAASGRFAARGVAGALFADRADLRRIGLLLRLDVGQHIAKVFILGDRGMGHALLAGIKDPIGQQDTLPADLEGPVGIAIGLDITADRAARMLAVIEDELPALIMHHEAGADLPLVTNTEDIGQT